MKRNHSPVDEGIPAQLTGKTIWKMVQLTPMAIGAVLLILAIALEHPDLLGTKTNTTVTDDGFLSYLFAKKWFFFL
ncbi:hypothetical protein J7348_11510 [Qipengyuania flava]|uniref:hypothetical protein n=1 Tax=Qipengyuania flava TaxID=192812 RepID=UPI001ADD59E7|nr:hypothetical protein [Qipengyuania flava]MBO9505248.1 hypothetical protein [Qipengyuania flava]